MKPTLNPINIGSVANGAAVELFDAAVQKVIENIADTSTDATAVREVTLTFKFKPDEERRAVLVVTKAKTKLAPIADHTSKIYVGKDSEGNRYAFDQDPRQDVLFEPAQEKSSLIPFQSQQ